jgi:2-methylaconitate cis-trans-isomerase PrpF
VDEHARVDELDVVIMRGGTSKGVFVRLSDLPGAGPERDALLLALMGSPDPMQLDGLGGTHSSTSKVVAVGPGREDGVDVEYLFAQVGIDQPVVDYTGNCGNLTSAVAPYSVDVGLVEGGRPVVLLNLNTGVKVRVTIDPSARVAIDGVPGEAPSVTTEYLDPAGSVTGKLFPTGARRDLVDGIEVSVVDVASPHVFLRAADVGLTGAESPADLNGDAALLDRLERLRAACGTAIGVDSRAIPRLVMVAPGEDLRVIATSMQRAHHAVPITGALCTAAAARLDGTVAHEVAVGSGPVVRVQHPKGMVAATVDLDPADGGSVRAAGVVRTARRLLTGRAVVRP